VTLFDAVEQKPPSKARRYVITVLVLILLLAGSLWWMLRFHAEKVTILHFMNAVIAGNLQQAYQIWKPSPSYSFNDFTQDWGPSGYYGPIKSFHLEKTEHHPGASGVVIKLELSPFQPFPEENDMVKQNKTKEVALWVELKDESISYPPY
jgi:hypothetical protein